MIINAAQLVDNYDIRVQRYRKSGKTRLRINFFNIFYELGTAKELIMFSADYKSTPSWCIFNLYCAENGDAGA